MRPRAVASRVLLAAGVLFSATLPAYAPETISRESKTLNYVLEIPARWTWKPVDESLKKHAVAEVADRILETLSDGKTEGGGRGGLVMLSVDTPPKDFPGDFEDAIALWQTAEARLELLKGVESTAEIDKQRADLEAEVQKHHEKISKDLEALASRSDVTKLLLQRFQSPPEPSPPSILTLGGIPAAQIEVKGDAGNLKGVSMACTGQMFVLVLQGKMHRLVTWAWTTPRDREGVKSDIDVIEINYTLPKGTAKTSKPQGAGPAAGPEVPVGDGGEEKKVGNVLVEGWELTKPVGFRTVEIDRTPQPGKPAPPAAEFQIGIAPAVQTITLQIHRSDARDAAGAVAGPLDLKAYYLRLWPQFLSLHAAGPLESYKWQPIRGSTPFLSLPDLEPEQARKAIKRPPPGEKKEWDWKELERLGLVSEAENFKIGKVKVDHGYRMAMKGERERVGTDINIYYGFAVGVRTYILRISGYQDSVPKYAKETKAFLDSFVLDPPK